MRPWKRRGRSFRIKLFKGLALLLACTVIPATIAGFIYHNIYIADVRAFRHKETQEALDTMRDNVDAIFRTIDRAVVNSSLNLELYSYLNTQEISAADNDYYITYLTGMLNGISSSHKSIYSVYLYSTEKNTILTSNESIWSIQDFYDLSWKDTANRGHYNLSFTDSRVISNRFDKGVSILSAVWPFYTQPANYDLPNYIVVNFYEQRLIDLLMSGMGRRFDGSYLFIVDSEKKQMLRVADSIYRVFSEQELDQLITGKGSPFVLTIDRRETEVFCSISGFNKWVYVLCLPLEQLAGPIWLEGYFSFVVSIVSIFGFMVFLLIVSAIKKEETHQEQELITHLGNAGFNESFTFGAWGKPDCKSGFVAVLVSIDGCKRLGKSPLHAVLSEAMDTILYDELNAERQMYMTAKNSKQMQKILVLQVAQDGGYEGVANLFRAGGNSIRERLDVTISVGISAFHHSKTEIPASIEEAAEALKYRFVSGGGSILCYGEISNSQQFYCPTDSIRMEIFSGNLSNGRVTEARAVINKTAAEIKSMGTVFYASALRVFLGFLDSVDSVLKLKNTDLQRVCGKKYKELYFLVAESETMLEAAGTLGEILDQYEEYLIAVSPETKEDVVERMLSYIDENHDKEINLSMFATSVYFTESYLSRLFKQRTGENFLQYLTRKRIMTAKEMLKNPEYRISDIAEKLSFGNSKAFIRAFKKFEGITPGRFRKGIMPNADLREEREEGE